MEKHGGTKQHLRSFRRRAILIVAASFIAPPFLASIVIQLFI
jgi:hypothetical protein